MMAQWSDDAKVLEGSRVICFSLDFKCLKNHHLIDCLANTKLIFCSPSFSIEIGDVVVVPSDDGCFDLMKVKNEMALLSFQAEIVGKLMYQETRFI